MIQAPASPVAMTQSSALIVRLRPLFDMTPEDFYEFCRLNPGLNLELTEAGELVLLPPSGGATGARNLFIAAALWFWARGDGSGMAFDSSAGFVLPNGAIRAPDVAWVKGERWAALTPEQQERFLPFCPDFVVEVASPSDQLADLQAKMDEYMANGAQLGWLIVPRSRSVYVYRPGHKVEHLREATAVSGDPLLPGFTLDLASLWQAGA